MMSKGFKSVKDYFINNEWILVFLLFFPFVYKIVLPSGILMWFFETYKQEIKLICFLIILFKFIHKRVKPSILMWCLIVFDLWLIFATYSNNGIYQLKTVSIYVISSLVMAMLVEIYKDNPIVLIKGLLLNFEIFLYLNFVTVLLYNSTKGYLGSNYLLGYYNTLMVFTYPAICVAAIYMSLSKKYVRSLILIIVSILTIILAKGSTPLGSLICSIGVFVVLYLLKNTKVNIPFWLISLLLLLFNIFIVFIFEGGKYKLIDFIIEKVLNRNTTFTGRLTIWESALDIIKNNLLIGCGYKTSIPYIIGSDITVVHAHNTLLTTAVNSGIIGLILFFILHCVLIYRVDKTSNSIYKFIMIGLLAGIFLSYTTDSYTKDYLFLVIFFLTYHLSTYICKKK
jgi:O-antigen ligase